MDWFKQHVDTIVVLGAILSSVIWMNGKFTDIDKEISGMKTEIAVIKAVLIIQKLMPSELAIRGEKNEN